MSKKLFDLVSYSYAKQCLEDSNSASEAMYLMFIKSGLKEGKNQQGTLSAYYRVINHYGLIKERDALHKRAKGTIGCNIPLDQAFVENSKYHNSSIKRLLIENKLAEYQCAIEECPTRHFEGLWCGKLLNLDLDHINGNNKDNRLENLRFLCKNCHGLTDTFCGKNKESRLYSDLDILCPDCGQRKGTKRNKRCKDCSSNYQRKGGLDIVTPEALRLLLDKYSINEIAFMYSTTIAAVESLLTKEGNHKAVGQYK